MHFILLPVLSGMKNAKVIQRNIIPNVLKLLLRFFRTFQKLMILVINVLSYGKFGMTVETSALV